MLCINFAQLPNLYALLLQTSMKPMDNISIYFCFIIFSRLAFKSLDWLCINWVENTVYNYVILSSIKVLHMILLVVAIAKCQRARQKLNKFWRIFWNLINLCHNNIFKLRLKILKNIKCFLVKNFTNYKLSIVLLQPSSDKNEIKKLLI